MRQVVVAATLSLAALVWVASVGAQSSPAPAASGTAPAAEPATARPQPPTLFEAVHGELFGVCEGWPSVQSATLGRQVSTTHLLASEKASAVLHPRRRARIQMN